MAQKNKKISKRKSRKYKKKSKTKKTTNSHKKLFEVRIIKILNKDYKDKLIDKKTYKMLVKSETNKNRKITYKSTPLLKKFLKENWYNLSDGEIVGEIISKTLWLQ